MLATVIDIIIDDSTVVTEEKAAYLAGESSSHANLAAIHQALMAEPDNV